MKQTAEARTMSDEPGKKKLFVNDKKGRWSRRVGEWRALILLQKDQLIRASGGHKVCRLNE